jgi:hypothetical protein
MKKHLVTTVVSFIIGISLMLWLPCIAESALQIQTARVDFVGGYLYIYGSGFDKGSGAPIVSLGRIVLPVSSNTGDMIKSVFDPTIPDGEYLLTVSTGNDPNRNASISFIIGALGGVGPAGPAGAQGPAGSVGPQGPTGPAGATGATGPQGLKGDAGAQGPAGPIGPAGPQGPIGPIGPAGPQGAQGLQGLPGAQGPVGLTGATGPGGLQGPAGVANGITRAIHGDIAWDGGVYSGTGFSVLVIECNSVYCQTRVAFNTPFDTTPTCTATARGPGDQSVIVKIQELSYNYFLVTYTDESNKAVRTGFTFICVQ